LISVKPGRRRPLTDADLLKIRDQWGDDRVVNTLLWEIARLRNQSENYSPGQSRSSFLTIQPLIVSLTQNQR
jgi:hypothetical protein